IAHVLLSQGVPNVIFFNYHTDPNSTQARDDEVALNNILLDVRSACSNATRIVPILKARTRYDSKFVVSAVYLDDTHHGIARITFDKERPDPATSADFELRGVSFSVPIPSGGTIGVWMPFNTLLDIDNLTTDDANAMTFDDANILKFAGSDAFSFDEANA